MRWGTVLVNEWMTSKNQSHRADPAVPAPWLTVEITLWGLLFVTAVFMILLVLVQRGKGGGLAGAFGGMGGQSAFGTKAGDLFTRITVGVAAFWIILCLVTVKLVGHAKQEEDRDTA